MKRLIAALLTVAMTISIVPFSAFADESGADALLGEAAVESTETQQEDIPLVPENTDDLFQQNDAQEQAVEEQTQQAEVDTSDVSLTATNSFGQLLVNSMDEQNGASGEYSSRITGLKLNGHTATVEFVADQDADLVVAVYTDSDAEEMVASGTVEVSGDGGNSSAAVAVQGDIPEYYTVKTFLLNKTTHEPLSQVYTDVSRTEVIVDLSTAKVSDFPEDRVINLDGQDDTNFAVVSDETTLVTYEDNTAGQNQVISEDDDTLVYVIGNASDEIKNLQLDDILTYEYEPGVMLIARVQSITVDGDTVTIHGDDTLDISDVFDAVKIENDADNSQLEYDASTADAGVTYLGEEDTDFSFVDKEGGDWLDESNGASVSLDTTDAFKKEPTKLTGKASKKFEFQAYGGSNSSADGDTTAQASISGTINVSMSVTSGFYIAKERKYFSLAANFAATADATASGSIEVRKRLGSFGFSPIAGCYVGIDPTFVSKAEVKMTFTVKTSATIGFVYDSANGGMKDTSKAPYIALGAKATGSLYAGIDLSPNIKILGKVTVLALKVEVGGSGSFSETVWSKGNEDLAESIHGCSQCYTINLKGSVEFGGSLTVLKKVVFDTTVYKKDWDIGNAYSAPDYNDFGWGKCPHQKYRVTISVAVDGSEGMTVYSASNEAEKTELGKIGPALVLVAYFDPGSYTLTAIKDDRTYGAKVTVENTAQEAKLYWDGSGWIDQPTDPKPGQPDEPETPDYVIENGRLTINSENIMLDYESAEETPWYNSRDEIDRILTQYMVKKISSYAFADCDKVTEVHIGDEITEIGDYAFSGCSSLKKITFVGTMAKWKEIQIGIGNDVLNEVTVICSDGVINASVDENILASGKCGENAYWTLSENGVLEISGDGLMYDYSNNATASWYGKKDAIKSIIINRGITNIGAYAFFGCYAVKNIAISNTVTSVNSAAFLGCSGLEGAELPDTVININDYAFAGCNALKSFTIPNGVTRVENGVFEECKALKNIVIPESVTSIGENAFNGCWGLNSIRIPDSVVSIEKSAFEGCSGITEINISAGVTSIEENAFSNCMKLTSVVVPGNVTEIGYGTFAGCKELINAELLFGVEKVGRSMFSYCSKLTNVSLPASITTIGAYAFAKSGIESIVLPQNVEEIEFGAFEGCDKLTEIEMNEKVTTIGYGAFKDCSNLKDVVFNGTKAQWNAIAIVGANENLLSATIHCTDGDIIPASTSSENSVTTGSTTANNGTFCATFDNVSAGKDYAVIISRSANDPLNADNLIYINQVTADADGELSVPFRTGAGTDEMTYIVACARDDVIVDPDQPTEPDIPSDNDSGSSSGGGGDGAGAAVAIIGGVVAVAAVAGVVMLMPVEVSGTVKNAEQAILPGVSVQVLQGDTVVAQTITDEAGHFTVKVRRGDYTLNVSYTDTDGQLATKTIDIKAPSKNMDVAA